MDKKFRKQLKQSIERGDVRTVESLLVVIPISDLPEYSISRIPLLHFAVKHGENEIVKLLLNYILTLMPRAKGNK